MYLMIFLVVNVSPLIITYNNHPLETMVYIWSFHIIGTIWLYWILFTNITIPLKTNVILPRCCFPGNSGMNPGGQGSCASLLAGLNKMEQQNPSTPERKVPR